MKNACIIIPVFNEENNIKHLLHCLNYLVQKFSWLHFIIVNNGSIDRTSVEINANILDDHVSVSPGKQISSVSIPVNQGYGGGIKYGIRQTLCDATTKTSYDFIGWMHGDGQISMESIERYLANFQKNTTTVEILKGVRKNLPLIDQLFTSGLRALAGATLGMKISDTNGQPTLVPYTYSPELQAAPDDYKFDLYIFVLSRKRNISVTYYPVSYQARLFGNSKWNRGFFSRLRVSTDYVKYLLRVFWLRLGRGL